MRDEAIALLRVAAEFATALMYLRPMSGEAKLGLSRLTPTA